MSEEQTKQNPYRIFFIESPAGEKFMASLDELIDQKHQKGEDTPESARDYMQQAKGIREVVNLIKSKCAVIKE